MIMASGGVALADDHGSGPIVNNSTSPGPAPDACHNAYGLIAIGCGSAAGQ